MTRSRRLDERFDIDEPTSDTPNSTPQGPLEYGKRVDGHRLAAVSAGGGWWNPTTQELKVKTPDYEDLSYYVQQ